MHDDAIAALNEIARLAARYQPTPEQELDRLAHWPTFAASDLRRYVATRSTVDHVERQCRVDEWNGCDRYVGDRAEQARVAGRFSAEQLATYTAGVVELRRALDEAAWLGFLAPVSLGGEE